MLDFDPIRAKAPLPPTLPRNRPGALRWRPAVVIVLCVAVTMLGIAILLWSRLSSPTAPDAPLIAPTAGPGTRAAGGGMTATLQAAPLAAGWNILVVGVTDLRGSSIPGATVNLTAISREMSMGAVVAVADERQPGLYAADVWLDMAGRWEVEVQVSRPGGMRATFAFPIALIGGRGMPAVDAPLPSRRDS